MEKAYKFRIFPTPEQEALFKCNFDNTRYVWNYFRWRRGQEYKASKHLMGYKECSSELTELKGELAWLREADSTALQSELKDLDEAFGHFFRRVRQGDEKPGYPNYKDKRSSRNSYTSKSNNSSIAVLDKHIKIPKVGLVKAAISKQVRGRILSATVSKTPTGKYYASILCTDVEVGHLPVTGINAGIDLGLKMLAVTSDNAKFDNHKHYQKSQNKLKREQRRLSRKPKGSKNREKQRAKVALVHEKVANRRSDAIHKMTTQMVRDYDVICIEDLNVKGMVKNRRLAKHISDAAWGEVRRQLEYKSEWYGRQLVHVDRFFPSSQLCGCDYKNTDVKDMSIRIWICPECGVLNDRDLNAAINILNEGLRLLSGQAA